MKHKLFGIVLIPIEIIFIGYEKLNNRSKNCINLYKKLYIIF